MFFPKDDGAPDDCVGVGAGLRGAAPPTHRHLGTVRVRAPDLLMHTRHAVTYLKHRTNRGIFSSWGFWTCMPKKCWDYKKLSSLHMSCIIRVTCL